QTTQVASVNQLAQGINQAAGLSKIRGGINQSSLQGSQQAGVEVKKFDILKRADGTLFVEVNSPEVLFEAHQAQFGKITALYAETILIEKEIKPKKQRESDEQIITEQQSQQQQQQQTKKKRIIIISHAYVGSEKGTLWKLSAKLNIRKTKKAKKPTTRPNSPQIGSDNKNEANTNQQGEQEDDDEDLDNYADDERSEDDDEDNKDTLGGKKKDQESKNKENEADSEKKKEEKEKEKYKPTAVYQLRFKQGIINQILPWANWIVVLVNNQYVFMIRRQKEKKETAPLPTDSSQQPKLGATTATSSSAQSQQTQGSVQSNNTQQSTGSNNIPFSPLSHSFDVSVKPPPSSLSQQQQQQSSSSSGGQLYTLSALYQKLLISDGKEKEGDGNLPFGRVFLMTPKVARSSRVLITRIDLKLEQQKKQILSMAIQWPGYLWITTRVENEKKGILLCFADERDISWR
ncbi:MAG: hypothetical protein EZS28_038254, partial [Streblomastix strix]